MLFVSVVINRFSLGHLFLSFGFLVLFFLSSGKSFLLLFLFLLGLLLSFLINFLSVLFIEFIHLLGKVLMGFVHSLLELFHVLLS